MREVQGGVTRPDTVLNALDSNTEAQRAATDFLDLAASLVRPDGRDPFLEGIYGTPALESLTTEDGWRRATHADLDGLDREELRKEGRRCLMRCDLDGAPCSWLVERTERIAARLADLGDLESTG